ncbi:MAG: glycosyltransferase family 2 protein [Bacteroidales bacterium]|nr:glycosyltransferase family 2 protein [Bacteroidales bacterium]
MVTPLNRSNPFFSIIVPVHNVEQYLSACIDSILQQDFSSYEIILIDDGSIDGSWAICQDYASHDERIHCQKRAWGGVSKARNLGLELARGSWIVFADADDLLLPGALSIYHQVIAETDADIVKCGYIENRSGIRTTHVISKRRIIGKRDTASMLKETEESGYFGFLWNTAFRKSLLWNVRFDETISWLEDHVFSRQCFGQCCTLVLENQPSYEYFIRNRGSLSSVKDPIMMMDAAYKEYRSRINLLQEKEYREYEKKERLLYTRVLLASRLAGNSPLKQQVAFFKQKRRVLLRIPRGRMRYLQTILELISEKIYPHGH